MARVSAAIAPSPTPGKMNTLLAWPISRRTPSTSTGSNGEPVATTARPAVQRRMSAGVASALDVGLESGMTIGRAVPAARLEMTASSNAPRDRRGTDQHGRPDPLDRLDQARELGREAVPSERVGRTSKPSLAVIQVLAPVVDHAARIDEHDGLPDAASDSPSSSIARRSRRAMPMPAAPAPTSTTRASASRVPSPRRPASTPATTTAAVPWMSSLKDGTR